MSDEIWADVQDWKAHWVSIADVQGGGQASVKKVRSKRSDVVGFLKILNRQKDSGRRARFFREAVAYSTFNHDGVPRLVQSNAQQHSRESYNLFLVTEWIEGPRLADKIDQSGPLAYADAVDTTLKLLTTIEHCHEQGWFHRDIKPDNILLQEGLTSRPILVDFGMAYAEEAKITHQTALNEEIGNRFLRLPELSHTSISKRYPASDLSFIGGILFYLLTAQFPALLRDSNNRMPHQRKVAQLFRASGVSSVDQLMGIFDRCFEASISDRFSTASEMRESLQRSLTAVSSQASEEDHIQAITIALSRQANQHQVELNAILNRAIAAIMNIHNAIAQTLGNNFPTLQANAQADAESARITLGYVSPFDSGKHASREFVVRVAGEELVITVAGEVLHRTDLRQPDYGDRFARTFREIFLQSARGLVEAGLG